MVESGRSGKDERVMLECTVFPSTSNHSKILGGNSKETKVASQPLVEFSCDVFQIPHFDTTSLFFLRTKAVGDRVTSSDVAFRSTSTKVTLFLPDI